MKRAIERIIGVPLSDQQLERIKEVLMPNSDEIVRFTKRVLVNKQCEFTRLDTGQLRIALGGKWYDLDVKKARQSLEDFGDEINKAREALGL